MSKVLLMGPARSGKTNQLLDDFEYTLKNHPDPLNQDFFFLLPSAEHTERIISLIVQRDIPGFFHRRVTTFSSLVSEIFQTGDGQLASNVTRFLILRDLFEKEAFACFESVQKMPGFVKRALSFLMELKESRISAVDFRNRMTTLKGLEPDLSAKYESLCRLYEAYEQGISERGLHDRQDQFQIYQERKKAELVKPHSFKKLWLDGFFDFTNLQIAYLEELASQSEEITLSLTYDPKESRNELFSSLQPTIDALKKIGFEIRHTDRQKNAKSSLAHVEQYLFDAGSISSKPDPTNEITIYEAVGMEGEIEMIARTIRHMYRMGQYRLSDFAILLRQVGDYDSVIRSVFRRYQIPVEIHERERLAFAPMIQAISKLLKIFGEEWKREDVMDFLKSSYVRQLGQTSKSYETINAIEAHAKRLGIFKGREAWLEPWFKGGSEEEKHFDQLKVSIFEPLASLEDELKEAKHFDNIERLLKKAIHTQLKIFERSEQVTSTVRRDAATIRRFDSIMDEIKTSLQKENREEVSFDSFCDRFFRLIDLDLYSLRARDKNRVQVYDVSLARQKEYQVVFVAGLLEKRFPVQVHEDPILSDWERALFNSDHPHHLKERIPKQALERYLFYLAITRAKTKLFLTYPHLNLEGKEALASSYVAEVQSLFAQPLAIRKQELAKPYPSLEESVSFRELETSVMGELWRPVRKGEDMGAQLVYLTHELLKRPTSRQRLQHAFYEVRDEIKDPEILATGLFGATRMSATRLEEYAKCAFRYYAHRILRLEDLDENVNVMVRGTILHDVLENFFRNWHAKLDQMRDEKKRSKVICDLLEEALKQNRLILEKGYQHKVEFENMRQLLEQFLEAELDRLQGFAYQPKHFEFDFGGKEGDSPALEIEDGERKISVQGKIDRIDVNPENQTALVVDYKTSASFKKQNLELGTALQLPLYSLAAEKFLGLTPVGGELYSIKKRKTSGFYHKGHSENFPKSYARRMMIEDKEFRYVLERGLDYIKKFTRKMSEMNIEVRPRDCESTCPYPAVCRIEKWKLPSILESIQKEQKAEDEINQDPATCR